jgi:hypothetical protein
MGHVDDLLARLDEGQVRHVRQFERHSARQFARHATRA